MIFKAILVLILVSKKISLLPSSVRLIFVSLIQLFNLVIFIEIIKKDIVDFVMSLVEIGITLFDFVAPLVVYLGRWIFKELVIVKNFPVLTDLLQTLF
jgi:hypothetical protein